MATANEVLEQMEQHPELYVGADVCIVDPVTRTISVPDAYRILGVESDESVKVVPFQCPKMVEDDVDLTDFTLYINYVNAGGDFDIYSIENVKESGENITFDWIIRRSVTARRGTIRFILCAKRSDDEGNIIQEWNTTINDECESLEGLEGAPSIADQYPDIIQQILEKLQEIIDSGGGTGGPVDQEQIQQAVNDYLTKNPPSGMTTEQQQQLTKNTNDITDLKSALEQKFDNVPEITKIPSGSEWELLKENVQPGLTGWIDFENVINILYVASNVSSGNIQIYYTDIKPESDDDVKGIPKVTWPMTTESHRMFTLSGTHFSALLQAKYINFSVASDFTADVYVIKKTDVEKAEVYAKGDLVGATEKTVDMKLYAKDIVNVECIPGESYIVNFDSTNVAASVGIYADDIYASYQSISPLSDGMTIEIPEKANYLHFQSWVNNTITITGKFYGDLTRPSQKLVKENFDENIIKYIRENIGGNISGAVYYNCQDYGVIPGSSDNTEAFQELIDLVHENGGGVIWIPIGVYTFDSVNSSYDMTSNITTLLEAKSQVSILGESLSGSVLKVTGNTPQGAGLFCQNSVYSSEILEGCTYQNFTVDMSEASLTTYSHRGKAFYYSGIKDCVFRDLRLISTPSTSLGIDMLDNVVMDSIYVYEGGRQWADGGSGGAGIGIGTGKWQNENYIIRNCVCDSCGHFGIFLEDQGIFTSGKPKNYPKGQVIANNVIRNGRNYAIGVRGGKNVMVTGNNVYENKGGIYTDYGAKNIIFSNNLIQGCTSVAFNYGNEMSTVNGADYPCEEIIVIGNVFFDNAVGIQKDHTPTNSQEVNNIFVNTPS